MTIYPNIRFPEIDFSSLANLPKTMEEARLRKVSQTLGDLDPNKPEDLEKGAAKFFAAGFMEQGLKLTTAARDRRELERKITEGRPLSQALADYYRTKVLGLPPSGASEPAATAPAVSPAKPPVTPDEFGDVVNPLAPGGGGVPSRVPPGVPGVSGALPDGQTVAQAPTPSDELIMRAQAGQVPPTPRGLQFAQAQGTVAPITAGDINIVPKPDVSVVPPTPGGAPQPPTGALPGWMQGIDPRGPRVSPIGPRPQAAPAPIEAEVARRLGDLPPDASDTALRRRMADIFDLANTLPRKPSPALTLLTKQFEAVQAQAKWTDTEKSWNREKMRRWQANDPNWNISYDDYAHEQKVGEARFKEGHELAKTYQADQVSAQKLKNDLVQLRTIVEHPRFESGVGTERWGKVVSMLNGVQGVLRNAGVPEDKLFDLRGITEPVKLQEAFRAISNLAVVNKLGNLSRQVSDADRNYMATAFPNLSHTKEANKLIIETLEKTADHQIMLGREINKYRLSREGGARIVAERIHEIVDQFAQKNSIFFNPDGTPNDLKKRIDEELMKTAKPPPTGVELAGQAYERTKKFIEDKSEEFRKSVDPFYGKPSVGPFPGIAGGGRTTNPEGGLEGQGIEPYRSPIGPDDNGRVYYDENGKPRGRIKNGQPVPFGR